jgi:hypothetical protein
MQLRRGEYEKIKQTVLICVSRPGRQLATMFLHLPDRDDFPDYYQVITAPISLEQIEVGDVRVMKFQADFAAEKVTSEIVSELQRVHRRRPADVR